MGGIIPILNGERLSATYLINNHGIDMDIFRDNVLTGIGYFMGMVDSEKSIYVVFIKSRDSIEASEKLYMEKIVLFKLGGLKKEKRNRYGILERNLWNK